MANGAAALHALEPPFAPATALRPATATEIEIGKATAAAVIAIAAAIDDYATAGGMTPATRTWSGAMLGRLAQLRLETLGELLDFSEVASREGKRALQERPDGVLLTRLGRPGQVDAVIDELLGHVLAISAKVAADEQALRAN